MGAPQQLELPPRAGDVAFPFTPKPSVFSPTEAAFYRTLTGITAGRFVVFAKMRLLDVCFMRGTKYDHPRDFNKVVQWHVDFLLCDPVTFCARIAIELDDWTHGAPRVMARDAYVDELFARLRLPLLRFDARSYSSRDIEARLDEVAS